MINETKHYITFLGDGMNKTVITWNDTAGDFDDQDVLLKTYRSATVGISSEWFIAKGVTFVVSPLSVVNRIIGIIQLRIFRHVCFS